MNTEMFKPITRGSWAVVAIPVMVAAGLFALAPVWNMYGIANASPLLAPVVAPIITIAGNVWGIIGGFAIFEMSLLVSILVTVFTGTAACVFGFLEYRKTAEALDIGFFDGPPDDDGDGHWVPPERSPHRPERYGCCSVLREHTPGGSHTRFNDSLTAPVISLYLVQELQPGRHDRASRWFLPFTS